MEIEWDEGKTERRKNQFKPLDRRRKERWLKVDRMSKLGEHWDKERRKKIGRRLKSRREEWTKVPWSVRPEPSVIPAVYSWEPRPTLAGGEDPLVLPTSWSDRCVYSLLKFIDLSVEMCRGGTSTWHLLKLQSKTCCFIKYKKKSLSDFMRY